MSEFLAGTCAGGEAEEREMATSMRIQPLAASTAMLAQEHARLDRMVEAKRKEIGEMSAVQDLSGDDLVREMARRVALKEAEVQRDREALGRAEAALQTQARAEIDARAEARQQKYADLVADLRAAEDERCAAVGKLEHHTRSARDALNEAFRTADRVRDVAKALADLGGVKRPSFGRFNENDFAQRTGARISGVLATIDKRNYHHRLGPITWGAEGSLNAAKWGGWADLEREYFSSDVERAIAWGVPDAE
jgi:hypothetical protein